MLTITGRPTTTLLWDRLPLGIMFMGLFAAVIAERIAVDAGRYLPCL
ncbi:MAG: hypothetical protein IPI39_08645 [Candidatus Obscuribacter sp.]|nr:hypothetical protein [Candidatus Obscuribacter sp.]